MDSKILHGCGHSFHLSCFPHVPGICSICKVEIQDAQEALTTVSETVSHAIRNINVRVEQEDVQEIEEEDEDDDADDGLQSK